MGKNEKQGEGMEKKEKQISMDKKKGGVVEDEEGGKREAGKVMFYSLKKAEVT